MGGNISDDAVRLVGISFLLLAAYVAYDAITSLLRHEAPEKSIFGIGVAIASLIAMPLLAIMVLVNHAQASYRYASYPRYLSLVIVLGQGGAFIGVFAAFWHISWMAAVLLVFSGLVGLVVYAAYLKQLSRDNPSDTASGSQ